MEKYWPILPTLTFSVLMRISAENGMTMPAVLFAALAGLHVIVLYWEVFVDDHSLHGRD